MRARAVEMLAEHERVRVRVAEDYSDGEAIVKADFLITYTCDVVPMPRRRSS